MVGPNAAPDQVAQNCIDSGTINNMPNEMFGGTSIPFSLDVRVTPKLKTKIVAKQFVNFKDL